MVNFLTDEFPEAVIIDGVIHEVNTDFRVGLQIMQDFEDPELDDDEKAYLMIRRLYKVMPGNVLEAIGRATKFLNAGEDNPPETEGKPRLYSFSKDAKLIYSAFSQTHGIDLQTAKMHWWKFLALFMDLGAETAFNSMVNLRRRYYDNKLTEEEKKLVEEMGTDFLVESVADIPIDEDEIEFISMLPAEDQRRYWESRNK